MNAIILIIGAIVVGGIVFFILKSKKTTPQQKEKIEVEIKKVPKELSVLDLTDEEIKELIQEQIKEAQKNLGVDESLIKELYENELISQLENAKEEFYSALENKDYDKLEKVSHSLKGAAQNLGIKVVGDILQTIVNKTRAKEELEEIKIYVDAVYELLPKLRVN